MRTIEEVVASLPAAERALIRAKAKRLIRAETLRQLRTAARKTQQEVAAATGVAQHNISRLERRDDMLLSTLQAYVGGLGGRLRLVAEFPTIDPVELDFSGQPMPAKSRSRGPRLRRARVTAT